MTKAIVYSRVSTDAQERDGTSLETQERACIEHAERLGWRVVRSIRDHVSGAMLERDGLTELRAALRRGEADVVVAYAVDRLSRNQNHIGILFDEFQGTGTRLELVTERFEDTAVGRFVLAARAFVAEVEREKIAERTMRGKAERARSGRLPQGTGRGIFGYRYSTETGRRVVDANEADVVRRIFAEFDAGRSTLAIANGLNDEAIPTFTGKQWSPATLVHMLRNETYTGRTVYRRTMATATHRSGPRRKVTVRPESDWIEVPEATPAIITADVFARVQERLDDPERRRQGRRKHVYGLSGHIGCPECRSAMVGQTQQGRYRYYRCRRAFAGPRHDRCDSRYVRADALESAVLAVIAERLAQPELVIAEMNYAANAAGDTDTTDLTSRLAGLENQRKRLLRLYQLGEIDDDYLARESAPLRRAIATLEQRMSERQTPRVAPRHIEDVRRACDAIRTWVLAANGNDVELLADALQLKVWATPAGAEVEGVIPDSASPGNDAHVRSMVINTGL